MFNELTLAFSYEDLVNALEQNMKRLTDLLVPVTEFESQIVQVIQEIRQSGYLLFLYGVSGSGKSTFISSLTLRKHIPISSISHIDAAALSDPLNQRGKLKRLYFSLDQIVKAETKQAPPNASFRPCIVIDYLESLQDEAEGDVVAFFRDLNALLRKAPVLVVWPVTVQEDVENMQRLAANYSSTMFHRRMPVMEFTGPRFEDYSIIARKTIEVLNPGKSYHDFQLNDSDFDEAGKRVQSFPKYKQTIREYLQTIRDIWEDRTEYVAKVRAKIPGATEVWFVVCYPEAEQVVAQFSKRSQQAVADTWNADYTKLWEYVRDSPQRRADWPATPQYNRLGLALTGVLTTKILYLPTYTFVTCITAYAEDVKLPINREKFEELGVQPSWFAKSRAALMLRKTPLYLQLAGLPASKGNRRGGTVPAALDKARKPFDYINKLISQSSTSDEKGSDKPLNKAMALALKDSLLEYGDLEITAERRHPWLGMIPDILITTPDNRSICIEFYYTNNAQSNRLAAYCLNKLDTYMKQVESLYRADQLFLL